MVDVDWAALEAQVHKYQKYPITVTHADQQVDIGQEIGTNKLDVRMQGMLGF